MSGGRFAYEYAVLRYMHDIATGEFINVGILASSKDGDQLKFKFRTTYTRLKGAFPSLDGDTFRHRMKALRSFYKNIVDRDVEAELLYRLTTSKYSTLEFAHLAVPPDDSFLQWSQVGAGLTRNLHETTEKLFERFVSAHDNDHVVERRKDEDVWQLFSSALERRNVAENLVEKTIEVADDSIRFSHAWKNGIWHCFEPLSFDLASEDSIKGKAHRWLGRLSSVKGSRENFNVYFLVGKPKDADSFPAYEGALNILRKYENAIVVEDHDTEAFGESIAARIVNHRSPPLVS